MKTYVEPTETFNDPDPAVQELIVLSRLLRAANLIQGSPFPRGFNRTEMPTVYQLLKARLEKLSGRLPAQNVGNAA